MTTWVSTDLNLNRRDFYEENRWQKFGRKLKEEPLIPLGMPTPNFPYLKLCL